MSARSRTVTYQSSIISRVYRQQQPAAYIITGTRTCTVYIEDIRVRVYYYTTLPYRARAAAAPRRSSYHIHYSYTIVYDSTRTGYRPSATTRAASRRLRPRVLHHDRTGEYLVYHSCTRVKYMLQTRVRTGLFRVLPVTYYISSEINPYECTEDSRDYLYSCTTAGTGRAYTVYTRARLIT